MCVALLITVMQVEINGIKTKRRVPLSANRTQYKFLFILAILVWIFYLDRYILDESNYIIVMILYTCTNFKVNETSDVILKEVHRLKLL